MLKLWGTVSRVTSFFITYFVEYLSDKTELHFLCNTGPRKVLSQVWSTWRGIQVATVVWAGDILAFSSGLQWAGKTDGCTVPRCRLFDFFRLHIAFVYPQDDKWTNFPTPTFSAMDPSYSLPDNVAIITLQVESLKWRNGVKIIDHDTDTHLLLFCCLRSLKTELSSFAWHIYTRFCFLQPCDEFTFHLPVHL